MLAEKPICVLIREILNLVTRPTRRRNGSIITGSLGFLNLAVVQSTPYYAMWDDHDNEPNNSNGIAVGK